MNHIGGVGGYSSSARWRKTSITKRGEKALSLLQPDHHTVLMVNAHNDSEALRQFAERFDNRDSSQSEESTAQFELDQQSGQIQVSIYETSTGKLQMKLTPEEVAVGLKTLEETDDNAAPLSSFFVDIKI